MAERYPQPPGDEGSRRKLANRKATVDNVAKGYMGIVNIYQLVPKGMGGVPISSIGMPPAPPGTKIYPQKKPVQPKIKKSELANIKRKLSVNYSDVGWKMDTSERHYRLAAKEGNIFGGFLIPSRSYTPADKIKYESELNKHPDLVSTEVDRKKLNNAFKYLDKALATEDRAKFDAMLLHQAMNLQTYVANVEKLYREYKTMQAATKAEEQKKRETSEQKAKRIDAQEEAEIAKISSTVPRRLPPISPTQFPGIEKVSESVIRNPSFTNRYIELANNEVPKSYSQSPKSIKYIEDRNGNIKYYVDLSNALPERRRRLSKMKIKRKSSKKIVPRKVIKSNRRKVLLKKIRCRCKSRRH